jgi:hypothetical protein
MGASPGFVRLSKSQYIRTFDSARSNGQLQKLRLDGIRATVITQLPSHHCRDKIASVCPASGIPEMSYVSGHAGEAILYVATIDILQAARNDAVCSERTPRARGLISRRAKYNLPWQASPGQDASFFSVHNRNSTT